MITTSEIAPSLALTPFVRCYSYREFDTNGMDMERPMHAAHEMSLTFFFKARPIKLVDFRTDQIIRKGTTFCDITGMSTHCIGTATFNGNYSFFEICFKPNGFNKIFGLALTGITDHIIPTEDILDINFKYLFEQLCVAKDLNERGTLADAYLLGNLKRRKQVDYKHGITIISNLILKSTVPISVRQLAYSANMSIRNFERQFSEEVGMSPKLFSNVVRFNRAFEVKLRYPQKDWTTIALECGYFDQTHLIKDFKRFTGNAPAAFLRQTPVTDQEYISRVEL